MTIADPQLVQRIRLRLAVAALLLAAVSVIGAIQADRAAATHAPSCWTRGHYITAFELNSGNNTIGHKVVCDRDVDVTGKLLRYNRSTGMTNVARLYSWNNANYSNGSWINTVNPAVWAPLYCGSNYMLRLTVVSATGASTTYNGPWLYWC